MKTPNPAIAQTLLLVAVWPTPHFIHVTSFFHAVGSEAETAETKSVRC